MNNTEKLQKLENAKNVLKSEFIGLNSIIDRLITSITPWYVTPEILTRPLIISLWGITGTGKTCVVRRLLELLEVPSSVFFDIEEESSRERLGSSIIESLAIDESKSIKNDNLRRTVFVFDEFQHARTIDESGREIAKPSTRQMWNLIDSGIIEMEESWWEAYKVNTFLEDFAVVAKMASGATIENLKLKDGAVVKTLLECLGLTWYSSRADEFYNTNKDEDEEETAVEKAMATDRGDGRKNMTERTPGKSPLRPIKVIPRSVYSSFVTIYMSREGADSISTRIKELMDCKTIGELYSVMLQIKKYTIGKVRLDFSQSLVFLIGNLDEAFYGAKNLSADLNADHFKKDIEEVTISDIKTALKDRFRAEQIARFGNVILKYPAFSSEEYKEIIRKTLRELLYRFKELTGKAIFVNSDIVDLIFFEGVFPSQGARPVFTTINSLFTPLLSNVVIDFENETDIVAGVVNPGEGYRKNTKTLYFKAGEKIKEYEVSLIMGYDRNPENNPDRYTIGVHEAGHAVVECFLTGMTPDMIMSTSADGKGRTFDSSEILAATTLKHYVKKMSIYNIKSLLGGYCAELEIFGSVDKDLISFGSGSDLEAAYERLANAAYKTGFYTPMCFTNLRIQGKSNDGVPYGISSADIDVFIKRDMEKFIEETKEIIHANRDLIKEMGLLTAELGELRKEQIEELIKKHETIGDMTEEKVTIEKMEKTKKSLSIDTLRKILES